MRFCDLSFRKPEENLACDEVLLELAESGATGEILRFWEPTGYFVVVGYANQVSREVNLEFCKEHDCAVLRRCSGGGTVVQGPGCLNYTLVLRTDEPPPLQTIPGTNEFVLRRHQQALTTLLGKPVEHQGHTDLAIAGVKFSGNAQRRKRHFLLFHGTFLLNMDIALVEQMLPMPSKQPAYRLERSHKDFLLNLRVSADAVKLALRQAWQAQQELPHPPVEQIARLAQGKYSTPEWNFKF